MIRGIPMLAMAMASCLAVAATNAQTDREPAEDDGDTDIGSCIRVNAIRRSHIVDDSTVLLEMRGNRLIRMTLVGRCPQLRFHDFFSYEPHLGQLCAELDKIVTRAGFHCPIAGFSALDPANDPRKQKDDP